MSLNIKNDETVRLAKEVAARTGESLTAAITVALEERLARLDAEEERRRLGRVAELMKIARDSGPRWKTPVTSTSHGDDLYDDRGLPR